MFHPTFEYSVSFGNMLHYRSNMGCECRFMLTLTEKGKKRHVWPSVQPGFRVVKVLKTIQKYNIMKKWKNMETPHSGTYQREGMRFTYQHFV